MKNKTDWQRKYCTGYSTGHDYHGDLRVIADPSATNVCNADDRGKQIERRNVRSI